MVVISKTNTVSNFRYAFEVPIQTLLIDNYDSYTYNIFQYLTVINGLAPIVVFNDDFNASWKAVESAYPNIHNVIISPGPGRPESSRDFGMCGECLKHSKVPVLGICLGHQGLCYVYGGKVIRSPEPVHGRWSTITFLNTCRLFDGVSQSTAVVRYHSLCIDSESLPTCLRAVCWTNDIDCVIMGVEHISLPYYGVQFHPESIGTTEGARMLANFKNVVLSWWKDSTKEFPAVEVANSVHHSLYVHPMKDPSQSIRWKVNVALIDCGPQSGHVDTSELYQLLYSQERVAFWLDSSAQMSSSNSRQWSIESEQASRARFSFMGDANGPLSEIIEYWKDGVIRQVHFHKIDQGSSGIEPCCNTSSGDIFDILRSKLMMFSSAECSTCHISFDSWKISVGPMLPNFKAAHNSAETAVDDKRFLLSSSTTSPDVPFDFLGGYVGFFGYEVRHSAQERLNADRGRRHRQPSSESPHKMFRYEPLGDVPSHSTETPDAFWIFSDRLVAIDHKRQQTYIVWICPVFCGGNTLESDSTSSPCDSLLDRHCLGRLSPACISEIGNSQKAWVNKVLNAVRRCTASSLASSSEPKMHNMEAFSNDVTRATSCSLQSLSNDASTPKSKGLKKDVHFVADRTKKVYEQNIRDVIEEIRCGETYEVCLTNHLEASNCGVDPLQLFNFLRSTNPAPFSAFLKYDMSDILETGDSFAICCSSPERFLKLDRTGCLESKPIKGTCRRGTTYAEDRGLSEQLRFSVKDCAENLMITDLIRNDLGRVCVPGSVVVPKLINLESYQTVHQLVSTVQGVLMKPQYDMFDAIVACFPGGSMSGAPKRRTLDIIERFEQSIPRGVYSGTLGFISINGTFDFNIVIRTIVMTPSKLSVGAGGAIVALSKVSEEYSEMLLKADSVLRACREYFKAEARDVVVDTDTPTNCMGAQ